MVEVGQRSALGAEAVKDFIGVHAALHDLDGHPLLERTVSAISKVNRTHAAGAQEALDAVGADGAADHRIGLGPCKGPENLSAEDGSSKELLGDRAQERDNFSADDGVGLRFQERDPRVRMGADAEKEILSLSELLGCHAPFSPRVMSRWSHARANSQCRETVGTETPST